MEQVELTGDRISRMDNVRFPEASAKAIGLGKFSPELIGWVNNRIRAYLKSGDKNQNFFGILRQAVPLFDIFTLKAGSRVFEVNTTVDLERLRVSWPLKDTMKT